ncbi:MAG: helix-turn-helix transcriptional regulator [Ignavibacteriaceae bacterium]
MLTYNLKKLFKLRGITTPASFLMKNGFGKQAAYRITGNRFNALQPEYLEKLCIALNCTPNDLMEWEPNKNIEKPEILGLNKLRPVPVGDLRHFANDIPVEKMSEFISQVEELKKKIKNVE